MADFIPELEHVQRQTVGKSANQQILHKKGSTENKVRRFGVTDRQCRIKSSGSLALILEGLFRDVRRRPRVLPRTSNIGWGSRDARGAYF